MPTAILLDVSLSMMKPASRNPPDPEVIDPGKRIDKCRLC